MIETFKKQCSEDKSVSLSRADWLSEIGEEGCVKMCQFFSERVHDAPLSRIAAQPREQGLGCKICYGTCLVPKDLEW